MRFCKVADVVLTGAHEWLDGAIDALTSHEFSDPVRNFPSGSLCRLLSPQPWNHCADF